LALKAWLEGSKLLKRNQNDGSSSGCTIRKRSL